MRLSLEQYAVLLAEAAAARSEDPFLQVGAALIRHDKTVAATGYNGAPPGIELDWSDRAHRRARVIHAEANALRYVRPGEVLFVATTHMPCGDCLKNIASYGIKLVVYKDLLPIEYHDPVMLGALAHDLGIELTRPEAT